ncbi:dihydrofolate reductase family protein [Chondromyces crocatus]|uniref:Deaminase n=1 Tax=Chondromyces crocatus TaxID=52 RepID=A0A0K1ENA5_CHOCO|nr:dihydrofolate reductase family protein [Chondromyces crocatus]AKT42112.1 deaminase [Chondromyces crocatus]
MRRLTYFVATSLDGFIASPEGAFDAFLMRGDHIEALVREFPETLPGPALKAMGISPDNATFDTVVMGWNTFAAGFPEGVRDPYPHLRQFVCSRRHAAEEASGEVVVSKEDPLDLVRRLKSESSERDVWLCGGGLLAAHVAEEIDRLVLKVHPILLGAGIPLFASNAYVRRAFRLESTRAFASGVVMNSYQRA